LIVIHEVITHHTKLNPEDAQNMFILRNLLAESGMVHSKQVGKRRIVINQLKTQFNPDINLFILRNLPTESAKVHSIASRENVIVIAGYNSSHQIQP